MVWWVQSLPCQREVPPKAAEGFRRALRGLLARASGQSPSGLLRGHLPTVWGRLASDGFAVRERLPLQGSWPSPRGLRGFGTARVQRMPPGTRRPGMPGPYRVAKLRIFRERHPYGRPGADLTLQINFGIVQQGNVLDDGKP